jgi:uncharacterized membrane protein
VEVLLVAAVVTGGLFAGAFLLYAHAVMPALRRVDDRTFVSTFALLDQGIVNPVFLLTTFLGAPSLSTAAAAVAHGADPFGWAVAAAALQVIVVGVTAAAHLPRNDRLKAGAVTAERDDAALRATFDETGWVRWNLVRVLLAVTATALLGVALLHA